MRENSFLLHTGVIVRLGDSGEGGYSLLEMILAISISSLLALGVFSIFFETLQRGYSLSQRSEHYHQLTAGLEAAVAEIREADPDSVSLLEECETGWYSQIQFIKYGSDDQYWLYLNADGQLIRAVRRPGKDWGRTSIAENVAGLYINGIFLTTGILHYIELILQSERFSLELSTLVSPGFS